MPDAPSRRRRRAESPPGRRARGRLGLDPLAVLAAARACWHCWRSRWSSSRCGRSATTPSRLGTLADEARARAAVSETLRLELDTRVADYNAALERKYAYPGALQVVDAVSKLMPDDTWLTQFELKSVAKGKEMQRELLMRGETANAGRLVQLFEESELFAQAAPRSQTTKIQPGPGEIFDLGAQLKPAPKTSPAGDLVGERARGRGAAEAGRRRSRQAGGRCRRFASRRAWSCRNVPIPPEAAAAGPSAPRLLRERWCRPSCPGLRRRRQRAANPRHRQRSRRRPCRQAMTPAFAARIDAIAATADGIGPARARGRRRAGRAARSDPRTCIGTTIGPSTRFPIGWSAIGESRRRRPNCAGRWS